MKRIVFFTLAIALIVVGCSKKNKTREEQVAEFRSELTSADTTAMLKICDEAMENLKAKEYDKVLASLNEYTDSTNEIKPLSKETASRYMRLFKRFPVLEYVRKYYSFQLEGCNDVKYEVTFATAEQTGTNQPAKTAFMFNPVRKDGEWKLCVKTADEQIDLEKR